MNRQQHATGVALFRPMRKHVLIRNDLSDTDLEQLAEADRREVDPPIQVQTAAWSKAGQLDWVKERQNGGAGYAVQTVVNGRVKAVDLRPARSA